MDRLKDLVTILYRPRETMRRILDRPDRWSLQIVFLAFVCASVNQIDARRLPEMFPAIHPITAVAAVALAIIGGALGWIALLFIVSWIVTPIGRLMDGQGSFRDVRAALAWSLVPMVFSPIYRLPLVLLGIGANLNPNANGRQELIDFVSRGGCSLLVLYIGFQILFSLACVALASFTVAEAQRFSTQKGFVNVAIIVLLPLIIAAAVVFIFKK